MGGGEGQACRTPVSGTLLPPHFVCHTKGTLARGWPPTSPSQEEAAPRHAPLPCPAPHGRPLQSPVTGDKE